MGATAECFGIKRIYDAPADDDGCWILVDRLRPRGVSKVDAQLDLWLKAWRPPTAGRPSCTERGILR